MAQQQIETQTAQQKAQDFARIERALAYIRANFRDQPELDDIADAAALSPFHFQRLFTRWAGVSPKQFLGYLTLDHAKRALDRAESVLDAAYDAGLSGPSRLHDLFVNFEGITPGQYKEMGDGLDIRYGVHPGFLGDFIVAATDRGICGLQIAKPCSALPVAIRSAHSGCGTRGPISRSRCGRLCCRSRRASW